jgi:histone acetyltransferase (RNA polymerase elongator complex component)
VKPVTIPFFISHQGCPHTCVFCDQQVISGSAGTLPTAEQMDDRIARWASTAGNRPLEVAFFGGTFTALPHNTQESLLKPLQPFVAAGTVASIRISTRPDYIDTAHLTWLSKMGVRTVELGVQSLDDAVLAASGRGHTAADSLNAIDCVRRCGLKAGVQLMPGLPGDTPAASLASLEQAVSAGADFLRIYPTVVLGGTELALRYEAGQYIPLSLERGVLLCKILLQRAMKANIPVIRIGLQADRSLDAHSIVAGCWHPALGQLVRSQLYADLINRIVSPTADKIVVQCHPARFSDVVGMGRATLLSLAGRGVQMQVVPDAALTHDKLAVSVEESSITYSIITDSNYSIDEV